MYFIKDLLAKYAADRGVWVAVGTWLAHFISKKLGLDLDLDVVVSLVGAALAWAVVHVLHVNTVDKSKDINVPEIK